MIPSKSETNKSKKTPGKNRAAEIANTFEWLITAFILAFVFRAFVMEAFRIPTGSMADTLKGAHFRMRCEQCGYKYEHAFRPENEGLLPDTIPAYKIKPPQTRCPSCGYYLPPSTTMPAPIANGDRILVLKCIYQFFEPKQWDVIVFKNPTEPHINYIKRLIGRPLEKVEIIDGDVYINDQISRKPPKVQNELWMPVYDNDYQPIAPGEDSFNGHKWAQPFNLAGTKWITDRKSPTLLYLDSVADETNTIVYDSSIGNTPNATYAYGEVGGYNMLPYCSDLMVRFYVRPEGDSAGLIGAALSKYESNYRAWVDLRGKMVITKVVEGKETELAEKSIEAPIVGKSTLFKFANVDHQLTLEFGGEELTYDMGRGSDAAGPIKPKIEPRLEIFGSGKLTLRHIAIFRDIHYTLTNSIPNFDRGRAAEGEPFPLKKDEFFVLGDNSPNSEDGRLWREQGKANKGLKPYRAGVVPRDYLVGKALFVYWPSGFGFPWPQSLKTFLLRKSENNRLFRVMHTIVSLRWIPNIGQVRFIYGGTEKIKS